MRVGTVATGIGSVLALYDADGWRACDPPREQTQDLSVIALLTGALRARPGRSLDRVRILPPLLPHRNLICLGKNYRAHAEEFAEFAGEAERIPAVPIIFTKPAAAICGAEEEITVDADLASALDYEAELGVVIGRGGRRIAEHDAYQHVAGYTIVNDVTARDLQQRHSQWFLGKSIAGATPVGPVIVSADEFTDLPTRPIRCWVNGELRQDATLGEMIFGVPRAIAEISRIFPLEPGDLIAMGTPSGVGVGFDPPRFLQDGDKVICEIDGIGRLSNTVRFVAGRHGTAEELSDARR